MPNDGNMSPLGRLLRNRLPGNGRRGRQHPADRLDAIDNALIFPSRALLRNTLPGSE
jgi:hypothetical protein